MELRKTFDKYLDDNGFWASPTTSLRKPYCARLWEACVVPAFYGLMWNTESDESDFKPTHKYRWRHRYETFSFLSSLLSFP